MDLGIQNSLFIICGATSGFGLAITNALLAERAKVIAIARNKEKLLELQALKGNSVEVLAADITKIQSIDMLEKLVGIRQPDGILVNASGPPAKSFAETTLDDWDQAYDQLLRWKVEITRRFIPRFQTRGYGRLLFIESSAVKQPIENLILSTSLRMSVTGFVKCISQENIDQGITFNILAPGYHDTPAIDRIIQNKSLTGSISFDDAKKLIIQGIPMKKLGNTGDFSTLALWLLSPRSEYVTGQVFVIDGGLVKSI